MTSRPVRKLSEYPRPWFYRPEYHYAFIIFPPVWSVLTLRSPWHSGEGFRGIMVGGIAWAFIIVPAVLSVRWVQNGNVSPLFLLVPGLLLTLITQIQWAAHRSRYGPPPGSDAEHPDDPTDAGRGAPDDGADPQESGEPEPRPGRGYVRRRPRRRRRRPVDRSADSAPLC